jgi:hypothetical protein
MMRVIIFQIMGYDEFRNSVPDLQVALVTQRTDEFTRTMVVVSDFSVTVDERSVTSRAPLCLIETLLFFSSRR